MNRPPVEVADIFRAQGSAFMDPYQKRIRFRQMKVMQAIVRCRTAALGGHIDACPRCGGDRTISYNSCLMGSTSLWGVDGNKPSFVLTESVF